MKFEITVLVGKDDGSSMVLLDRCTISGKNLKDAASTYAGSLHPSSCPKEPKVTWEETS